MIPDDSSDSATAIELENVDFRGQISVYVEPDCIYLYKEGSGNFSSLIGLATGKCSVTQLAQTSTKRWRPSMVHYEGFIFLIGGVFQIFGESLQSMEKFDIIQNTWTNAPSMNQSRHNHSSCVLGHKIFTFGGEDGND